MRHFDEFTIHRFRGIRDLKLEGLGQINLLVGDNNSGKTSVLEALSIYCDSLNWRKWYDIASAREVSTGLTSTSRLSRMSIVDRLIWLFPAREGKINHQIPEDFKILLAASGSIPIESVSAQYEKFSEIRRSRLSGTEETSIDGNEIEVEGIKINVATKVTSIQQFLFEEDSKLQRTIIFSENQPLPTREKFPLEDTPAQFISPLSHRLSGLPPQLWSDVVELDMKQDVIELMKLFDQNIEDIDIIVSVGQQPSISVKHGKLIRAPLSVFGDGLRRIFTLASAVPGAKKGLLLVDELETAIHTRILDKTFSWLVKTCVQNNVQLFATTHSLETVDALLGAVGQDMDIVVYRLRKGEDGIGSTRFNKNGLKRLRHDLGMEVR